MTDLKPVPCPVTLEDTATYLERRAQKAWKDIRKAIDKDLALHLEAEHRWRQQTHTRRAALVRAADVVKRAAAIYVQAVKAEPYEGCISDEDQALEQLEQALAAFDKISNGEQT